MFAFKKFSFFQQVEVKLHGFPANSTCHCVGPQHLFVGCDNGSIHVLDETYQSQGSFNAFAHKVLFVAYARSRNVLVAVGLEEPGVSTATLKLWDADRAVSAVAAASSSSGSSSGASPPPLRVHKVFSNKYPESEVTALAVHDPRSSSSSSTTGTAGGTSAAATATSSSTTAAAGGGTGAGPPPLLIAVGLAAGSVYLFAADTATAKGKLHHTGRLSARPEGGEMWRVTAVAFTMQPRKGSSGGGGGGSGRQGCADAVAAASATTSSRGGRGREQQAAAAAAAAEPVWLHVVTESQTLCYNMSDLSKTILDQQGSGCGDCVVVRDGLLVVARDDALYEYTTDTRAGCTAFDGVKQGLGLLSRYLYVVTDDTSPDGAARSQLQVLDVKNKLVAGSFTIPGLDGVTCGPGGLVAWASGAGGGGAGGGGSSSCRLYRFFEVELHTQLEVLFKRSLHKLALDLALRSTSGGSSDPALIAAIHQRWGDHLYGKAEYEAAMGQYLETIGHLEPSYVIRRFLDAQRITSLTRYLEQLHACGLAGADHTTLLLNCYTKLKDVAKLDAFIHRDTSKMGSTGSGSSAAAGMAVLSAAAKAARKQGAGGGGGSKPDADDDLKFDMETAFKVLRSAGYAAHALSVAERAGQPEWILDVLLEDMGSYAEAVTFIGMLSRPQKARVLQRYGKLLIAAVPDDTTALLMDLCLPSTDTPPPPTSTTPSSSAAAAAANTDESYVASVADFAQLYTDRPTRLLYLCEFILFNSVTDSPPNEQMLYHTLLELYLAERLVDAEQEGQQGGGAEVEPQARRDKARDLLQRGWQPHMSVPKYDPEQALVLCRQHSYRPGLVLLYEKKRLYREVLQVYMEAQDYNALIAACIQHGDAAAGGDPQLWAETLEYLSTQPGDCSPAISEVLQHIEAGALLPPLVVLQTLAKNKQLKVSLVKDYVARQLTAESAEISKDRATISRLQAETAVMKEEAQKLKTQPHVFQNSRCAATGQPLELPVVHFLCGHSFNLRSLGENDQECPLCAPDFKRVLDIRRNMKAGALKPDEFFMQLDASADGFSVVAEHFGRGLMNMTAQSMKSAAAAAAAAGAAGVGGVGSSVL